MHVLYIAKHGKADNDDEGAIAHALRELQHTVTCVTERDALSASRVKADCLLIHHWDRPHLLRSFRIPRYFWHFDLVEWNAGVLQSRAAMKRKWMGETMTHCRRGFCTDGDWVEKYPNKLVWLLQGADIRVAGRGAGEPGSDVLFMGSRSHCPDRASHIAELEQRYSSGMRVLERRGVIYRRALADVIAQSKIVVAPDTPVTDRYWSNRVYMTLGFGGFLIHPYCSELAKHYEDRKEIVFYRSRPEMLRLIDYYLERDDERQAISEAGLQRTLDEHTYTHRVMQLMAHIERDLRG